MGGAVNWTNTETWQRLVAAIVASGVKLDLHEVAKMYGTTYDTIQNRYRKIRVEADKLKQEVESGERSEVAATPKKALGAGTGTPRKAKGGKDALSTVTNGRVSKASPTKKKAVKQEKKNEVEDEGGEDDIFKDVDFSADSGDFGMDDGEMAF